MPTDKYYYTRTTSTGKDLAHGGRYQGPLHKAVKQVAKKVIGNKTGSKVVHLRKMDGKRIEPSVVGVKITQKVTHSDAAKKETMKRLSGHKDILKALKPSSINIKRTVSYTKV